MLVEHGAPITVGNSEGKTPVHYACLRGDPATVSALLSSGSSDFDATLADADGNTVVHASVASSLSSTIASVLHALPANQVDNVENKRAT